MLYLCKDSLQFCKEALRLYTGRLKCKCLTICVLRCLEWNLTRVRAFNINSFYPDAGLVIWDFSEESVPKYEVGKVLTFYVSDVFAGDSEAKYIYIWHQNGYGGVGGSTPELYLYELDHDFMAEDGETAFTPAARYYVDECTKDKLVLRRIEVNVDGPNLLENEVTFKKMGVYTK